MFVFRLHPPNDNRCHAHRLRARRFEREGTSPENMRAGGHASCMRLVPFVTLHRCEAAAVQEEDVWMRLELHDAALSPEWQEKQRAAAAEKAALADGSTAQVQRSGFSGRLRGALTAMSSSSKVSVTPPLKLQPHPTLTPAGTTPGLCSHPSFTSAAAAGRLI